MRSLMISGGLTRKGGRCRARFERQPDVLPYRLYDRLRSGAQDSLRRGSRICVARRVSGGTHPALTRRATFYPYSDGRFAAPSLAEM